VGEDVPITQVKDRGHRVRRWTDASRRVLGVILPKDRDPRFVTIRRGGTLTDSDHQLLALWAASCAEHVIDLFESAQPEDPRPRRAIELGRAWARGEITMTQARTAAGHAMAAARDLSGAARHAAYAAGQAAAVAHVAAHDQGRTCCRAGRRGRERRATRVPVAARPAPGGDPRARTRRPAVAERHLLVGVPLLGARRGDRTAQQAHQCVREHSQWRGERRREVDRDRFMSNPLNLTLMVDTVM